MDNKKTGNFIAEKRKQLGYSQKELSEKLNVTDKAVSKWETGRSMPDVSLLIPIANLFGVSVTELLNGEEISQENMNAATDELLVKSLEYTPLRDPYLFLIGWYVFSCVYYLFGRFLTICGMYKYNISFPENSFVEFLEIVYYPEANGIGFILAMIALGIMTIITIAFYGKYIAKPTLVFASTMLMPPLIYASLIQMFDHFEWVILTSYAICILHFVLTTIFLIKDIEKFDDI